ncbi:MAG: hypothetical protein M1816_004208 [Peltula sp. TS41687]|nr:MAG: hypothetical protein M1816_004208 [Peltula sp. TS41687]
MVDDLPVISILLVGDPGVAPPLNDENDNANEQTAQLTHEPLALHITLRNRRTYRLEFSTLSSPSLSTNPRGHKPAILILTYSVADPISLQNIQTKWATFLATRFFSDGEERPVLLLGLKRDLRRGGFAIHTPAGVIATTITTTTTTGGGRGEDEDEDGQPLLQRVGMRVVVDTLRAYKVAQDLRCDAYLECSARTGELVPQVKEDVARFAVELARAREEGGGGWRGGCVVC